MYVVGESLARSLLTQACSDVPRQIADLRRKGVGTSKGRQRRGEKGDGVYGRMGPVHNKFSRRGDGGEEACSVAWR